MGNIYTDVTQRCFHFFFVDATPKNIIYDVVACLLTPNTHMTQTTELNNNIFSSPFLVTSTIKKTQNFCYPNPLFAHALYLYHRRGFIKHGS